MSRLGVQTEVVGNSLYTYASLPFEIASLLLLVAIIGSVMLARTLKQEIAADDVDPEVVKQAAGSESGSGGGVLVPNQRAPRSYWYDATLPASNASTRTTGAQNLG